jgi:hypothetical protein
MFLVLDNCRTYNPKDNEFHELANDMEDIFLGQLKTKLPIPEKAAAADPPSLTPPPAFARLHAVNNVIDTEMPAWLTGLWPSLAVMMFNTGQRHATIRPFSQAGVDATMQLIKNRISSHKHGSTAQLLKVIKVSAPKDDDCNQADIQKLPLDQYILAPHRHAQTDKCCVDVQKGLKMIASVTSPRAT